MCRALLTHHSLTHSLALILWWLFIAYQSCSRNDFYQHLPAFFIGMPHYSQSINGYFSCSFSYYSSILQCIKIFCSCRAGFFWSWTTWISSETLLSIRTCNQEKTLTKRTNSSGADLVNVACDLLPGLTGRQCKLCMYCMSVWLCVFDHQDKANAHKKLLDDAEEHFLFKEEARDLVNWLIFCCFFRISVSWVGLGSNSYFLQIAYICL